MHTARTAATINMYKGLCHAHNTAGSCEIACHADDQPYPPMHCMPSQVESSSRMLQRPNICTLQYIQFKYIDRQPLPWCLHRCCCCCCCQGPSFSVDGMAVTWQKWSFRVGFNYRSGSAVSAATAAATHQPIHICHRFTDYSLSGVLCTRQNVATSSVMRTVPVEPERTPSGDTATTSKKQICIHMH
jgi:hypothetical protein